METGLSKKKIKESIIKMHNYLKTQDYYEDINSYALYTDFSINKSLWTYFIGTGNTSLDTIRLQSRKK